MKQALITGGARGFGWGVAEAMLAAGYAVTVTGLTEEEVAAIPRHEQVTSARLDVTDNAAVTACIARLARLDALVNCAGMILRENKEFTIEGFQKVIDVNLTGTMLMCVAARPLRGGAGGAGGGAAAGGAGGGGGRAPAGAA